MRGRMPCRRGPKCNSTEPEIRSATVWESRREGAECASSGSFRLFRFWAFESRQSLLELDCLVAGCPQVPYDDGDEDEHEELARQDEGDEPHKNDEDYPDGGVEGGPGLAHGLFVGGRLICFARMLEGSAPAGSDRSGVGLRVAWAAPCAADLEVGFSDYQAVGFLIVLLDVCEADAAPD